MNYFIISLSCIHPHYAKGARLNICFSSDSGVNSFPLECPYLVVQVLNVANDALHEFNLPVDPPDGWEKAH